jgi:hypothetical protein
MRVNPTMPAAPTEDQALSFLTELLRSGQNIGRNQYEVYLDVVAQRYMLERITVQPGSNVDVSPVIAPFYSAAWALCRLGVLKTWPNTRS